MIEPQATPFPGTAKWFRYDAGHSEQGYWVWYPCDRSWPADLNLLGALAKEGWERINTDNTEILVQLAGQFAPMLYIDIPGANTYQVWARHADIERIGTLPVMLGFSNAAEGITDPIDANGRPIILLNIAELLPPMMYGNLAFVRDSSAGYMVYYISQLGEAAQALQGQIAEAISGLVTPGQWWIIDQQMDLLIRLDGWEHGRKELRTAIRVSATKPADRVRYEAKLARLNTDYSHFQDWQERQRNRAANYPQWQENWERIQAMVIDLAGMYSEHHQRQKQALQASPAHVKAPAIRDAVKHRDKKGQGMLFVSTAFPVEGVMLATQSTHAWEGKPGTADRYHNFERGKRTGDYTQTSIVIPNSANLSPDLILGQINDTIARLGGLEGDIIFALLAQATIARKELDGSYYVTPEMFLQYRSVEHNTKQIGEAGSRTAGYQPAQRQAIIDAFYRVMSLYIRVRQTLGKGKRVEVTRGHLFSEVERIDQTTMLPDEKGRLVAWRVKPGTWYDEYDVHVSKHFGWLIQQVLNYDPKHQPWEKYLGRYFTFHLRIAAGHGSKVLNERIGTLITGSGINVDTRNPQRTRDHFEKAMHTLATDDVISGWEYEATGTNEPTQLDTKGWLNTWLDMKVQVTCAARVLEHGIQAMIDRVNERNTAQATAQEMLEDAIENGQLIRKRGRPPKPPIPHTNKRPRGRPRKD